MLGWIYRIISLRQIQMILIRIVFLFSAIRILEEKSIFIFGGETIRGFVFALLIGIFAGTFSSLFIAPTMAHILFGGKQADERIADTADKKRK